MCPLVPPILKIDCKSKYKLRFIKLFIKAYSNLTLFSIKFKLKLSLTINKKFVILLKFEI